MGQYCDSKVLEKNWFHWLLSSSVPDLESYRKLGLLWTKVVGNASSDGKQVPALPDPRSPNRAHCIALATPIYLNSYDGTIQPKGTVFADGKPMTVDLPTVDDELNLLSDSWLHRLDTPFAQADEVIPALESKGYIRELPTEQTWHAMLSDIDKMCQGIAMRFKQPTEEEQMELANEALLQVTNKLANYKLVYTPGLAPVFNLLTTTIHRCMYSIMNRRKTQRQGLQKFVDDVQSGAVPGYRTRRPPIKTG
jgi:hypothetical protein